MNGACLGVLFEHHRCDSFFRLGARKHVPWVSVHSKQAKSLPAGMRGSRVAASSRELGARAHLTILVFARPAHDGWMQPREKIVQSHLQAAHPHSA